MSDQGTGQPLALPSGATTDPVANGRHKGQMPRWATASATIASFATQTVAGHQDVYVPLATASLAGSLSAADKTLLGQITTGGPWIALPYAANWSDHGAGDGAGLYKKDPFGRVWLSGVAKKSIALALPDAICTLPVGYRPIAVHRWLTSYGGVTAEIFVATTGVVSVLIGGAAAGVSLDGIQFDPLT